ncbi:hypothetical protein AB1N83_011335 [Pleurotus pulmonarius]
MCMKAQGMSKEKQRVFIRPFYGLVTSSRVRVEDRKVDYRYFAVSQIRLVSKWLGSANGQMEGSLKQAQPSRSRIRIVPGLRSPLTCARERGGSQSMYKSSNSLHYLPFYLCSHGCPGQQSTGCVDITPPSSTTIPQSESHGVLNPHH